MIGAHHSQQSILNDSFMGDNQVSITSRLLSKFCNGLLKKKFFNQTISLKK